MTEVKTHSRTNALVFIKLTKESLRFSTEGCVFERVFFCPLISQIYADYLVYRHSCEGRNLQVKQSDICGSRPSHG